MEVSHYTYNRHEVHTRTHADVHPSVRSDVIELIQSDDQGGGIDHTPGVSVHIDGEQTVSSNIPDGVTLVNFQSYGQAIQVSVFCRSAADHDNALAQLAIVLAHLSDLISPNGHHRIPKPGAWIYSIDLRCGPAASAAQGVASECAYYAFEAVYNSEVLA